MRLEEKLTVLRKESGYTQLDLAEKVRVSRQAISKWETGRALPSMEKLKYLSELFGVSVDYLLSDDMTEEAKPKEQEPAPEPQTEDRQALLWFQEKLRSELLTFPAFQLPGKTHKAETGSRFQNKRSLQCEGTEHLLPESLPLPVLQKAASSALQTPLQKC